jgi:Zn finger protein HypA/HybF involved in hydrogenase expression
MSTGLPSDLDDVTQDDVTQAAREHLFGRKISVPAYCTECRQYEGDYEPDQRQVDCSKCGAESAVKSILVIKGFM